MKLFQINVTANSGSTGRIAENIGRLIMAKGGESFIAYARSVNKSESQLIKIGNKKNIYLHGLESRLFDNHGLSSRSATRELIKRIIEIKPDIIHLHNIHGYYLNYKILFDFLKDYNCPVVWTLHDCWSFTGHCAHFVSANCLKWQEGCYDCPLTGAYPSSLLLDRSKQNYSLKKKCFLSVKNLTLVPVSNWLENLLKKSFFKDSDIRTIHNGVDIDTFRQKNFKTRKNKLVLAVSGVWTRSKGLDDVIRLRDLLPDNFDIIIVGVSKKQKESLRDGIIGIERTESINELAEYYSAADVFINPTYADTFPTTNLEALACGTPVITYRTGGSPEAVDEFTGRVVNQGDIEALAKNVVEMCNCRRVDLRKLCRKRAEQFYNRDDRYEEYVRLYEQILSLAK